VIPWFAVSGALALLLGLAAIADGLHWFGITPMQNGLLVLLLFLTARAHVSGVVLLEAMFLACVAIHHNALAALNSPAAQFQLLAMPWRLALLGLSMVLFTQGVRWLRRRKPELVAGPFALRFFMAPSAGWIFCPAAILCLLAALYHTFNPALRESAPQLWAPYLGTVAFALVALFWHQNGFFAGTGLLLLLGNVHLVRVFFGESLRSHGVSELHLVCLGIGELDLGLADTFVPDRDPFLQLDDAICVALAIGAALRDRRSQTDRREHNAQQHYPRQAGGHMSPPTCIHRKPPLTKTIDARLSPSGIAA